VRFWCKSFDMAATGGRDLCHLSDKDASDHNGVNVLYGTFTGAFDHYKKK
jgi:hypothetical protein